MFEFQVVGEELNYHKPASTPQKPLLGKKLKGQKFVSATRLPRYGKQLDTDHRARQDDWEITGSMSEDRPSVPADIRRRVLVEAGHRCAIPTCRYIQVVVHHIVPWAICQCHEYNNLIALCPNCHQRADLGEIDRKSMLIYKANLRFAHDKFSKFEMDLLFMLFRSAPNVGYPLPPYLLLLVNRLLECNYIIRHAVTESGLWVFGAGGSIKTDPDVLLITAQGRAFIQSLGLHEL
jgi:hypothetical protein